MNTFLWEVKFSKTKVSEEDGDVLVAPVPISLDNCDKSHPGVSQHHLYPWILLVCGGLHRR